MPKNTTSPPILERKDNMDKAINLIHALNIPFVC